MSKKVIITGTSRGIGFELVKFFASQGYHILALSRNCEPITNLNLPNVHTFSCDITVAEQLQQVNNYMENNWDGIDILINNAGALLNQPFLETSSADFKRIYETNVFAVAEMIRICIPHFRENGHVVTISSMGGIQGSVKFPGLAAYSSSKGAVITLTELLAEEYKDHKLSFNVLALGAVQTEMLAEAFPGYEAPTTAVEMASYIYNFAVNGNAFYNGKILQVSKSTP